MEYDILLIFDSNKPLQQKVKLTDFVKSIIQKIEDIFEIPKDSTYLVLGGSIMEPERRINYYIIEKKSIVYVKFTNPVYYQKVKLNNFKSTNERRIFDQSLIQQELLPIGCINFIMDSSLLLGFILNHSDQPEVIKNLINEFKEKLPDQFTSAEFQNMLVSNIVPIVQYIEMNSPQVSLIETDNARIDLVFMLGVILGPNLSLQTLDTLSDPKFHHAIRNIWRGKKICESFNVNLFQYCD